MSCREIERLFVAGAEAQAEAHRKTCAECARTGADADETRAMTGALAPPPFSPALRRALLDIPRMTVTCEAKRVRNVASSSAESPPPTTAIGLPRKKNPSHVAHVDTP